MFEIFIPRGDVSWDSDCKMYVVESRDDSIGLEITCKYNEDKTFIHREDTDNLSTLRRVVDINEESYSVACVKTQGEITKVVRCYGSYEDAFIDLCVEGAGGARFNLTAETTYDPEGKFCAFSLGHESIGKKEEESEDFYDRSLGDNLDQLAVLYRLRGPMVLLSDTSLGEEFSEEVLRREENLIERTMREWGRDGYWAQRAESISARFAGKILDSFGPNLTLGEREVLLRCLILEMYPHIPDDLAGLDGFDETEIVNGTLVGILEGYYARIKEIGSYEVVFFEADGVFSWQVEQVLSKVQTEVLVSEELERGKSVTYGEGHYNYDLLGGKHLKFGVINPRVLPGGRLVTEEVSYLSSLEIDFERIKGLAYLSGLGWEKVFDELDFGVLES